MPGVIDKIFVQPGDTVEEGQQLIVMIAMKMEVSEICYSLVTFFLLSYLVLTLLPCSYSLTLFLLSYLVLTLLPCSYSLTLFLLSFHVLILLPCSYSPTSPSMFLFFYLVLTLLPCSYSLTLFFPSYLVLSLLPCSYLDLFLICKIRSNNCQVYLFLKYIHLCVI